VILAKGWEGLSGRERIGELATSVGGEVIDLPDDGYDWGAYFRLAAVVKSEFLCLLNTHSRILRDDWLALLHAQIMRPEIGLVGCSGSWGTMGWNWSFALDHIRRRWRAGRWAKAMGFTAWVGLRYGNFLLSRRRHFPSFPNPHIRSNAIILRTSHLREFAAQHRIPTTKHEAHMLECGPLGLSRFIENKGLDLILCGADNGAYPPSAWPDSRIFCSPDQPNLLVSDNVTREYDARSRAKKRDLELMFWGRKLTLGEEKRPQSESIQARQGNNNA
jgi:hypothetical protein